MNRRLAGGGKLAVDVLLAFILLVALAPILALIALCVVVDSRGPVFYRCRRVGRRGRQFQMLKFRKMHRNAAGGPLTLADDERFTRVGRWLARTRLDELPQLINVTLGQMSLAGPRPEDPSFVARHREAFAPVLAVRPGITGLSQLAYADESRVLDPDRPIEHYEREILPQKLQLDMLYVTYWTPLLDLRILLWTLAAMLLGVPVAVERSTSRITLRRSGATTNMLGRDGPGRATISVAPCSSRPSGPKVADR
jgi:lipopolysaccharide/colanic/teichoic acid biosynthesis glycosyltransferase